MGFYHTAKHSGILLVLTLTALLLLWVAAMRVFHFYITTPICSLPLLKHTDFCQTASHVMGDGHHSAKLWSLVCSIPALKRLPKCEEEPQTGPAGGLHSSPAVLKDQYLYYSHLINGTSASPYFGRDVREIILSLDDMAILLKASSLPNKDALRSHLMAIRQASRDSSRRLQKYTSRLLASITIILTSSDFTIRVAKSLRSKPSGFLAQLSRWLIPPAEGLGDAHRLQIAFFHTIKAFESLNRDLSHLNGETYESLMVLESHVQVLVDIVHGEALSGAKRELDELMGFGELLGCLWMILGGHRSQLNDARERLATLIQVGSGARRMGAFVLDVEIHLEKLQAGVDQLRAQAAEPLLIDSPIPVEDVIHALSDGCLLLKSHLLSTYSLIGNDGGL